jgi:hypothetical protein
VHTNKTYWQRIVVVVSLVLILLVVAPGTASHATTAATSTPTAGSTDGFESGNVSAASQVQTNTNKKRRTPTPTKTPTTTSTPSSGPTTTNTPPSGQPMPAGDPAGWQQVFSDDFTVPAPLGSFSGCSSSTRTCSGLPAGVKEKWWAYPDGWQDTSKNGTYSPSTVLSIGNGVLDMYLHTENGVHMVAAPVPRIPGAVGSEGGLLYGRYTMRFKADPLHGYKAAWLLWPDSEKWPQDGEIDFPEGKLDGSFCAYMHHQGGTSGSDQDVYCTSATYTSWHTATIEWLPSSVTFLLDGVVIGKSTSAIPNTPMHMVLQTETSTNGTVPADSTAGHVQVDWFAADTPTSSP